MTQPRLGATPGENLATEFRVWAPIHERLEVALVDDDRAVPMTRTEGGYHVATVVGTIVGDEYWYQLPDGRQLPDPASRHQPNGVHGPSAIVGPHFDWTDAGFRAPLLSELVLYEVHVGTFTAAGTFESAAPRLPELAELGVNAVELMPIAEFPGGRNWGYDGVAPFAAQSTYGGPDGLRTFVDAAHAHGIAVFLDVVYNHLGSEGNLLHEWGPYFTSEYATPWGDAVNFAGAGSDDVRRFFIESARWWVIDCHIDGLRVDAIHAIVDPSPRPFVEQLTEEIHRAAKEQGRVAVIIAESAANDPRTIRAADAGGFGFDAQWSDDFHHALHALLTGERDGYYEDFGALADLADAYEHGFTYDGRYSTYRACTVGAPTGAMPGERFVVFAQNHDQIGNRMNGERLSALVGPSALRLAAAAVLVAPFVPLLFMGEEDGVTAPFPYFVSHGDPELVEAVRKGRAREFAGFQGGGTAPDPQAESTFAAAVLPDGVTEDSAALRSWYRRLLALRRIQPQLRALDRDATSVSIHEREQTIVVARGRRAEVAVVLHFGAGSVDVGLPAPGPWRLLADSATGPPFDGSSASLSGAVVTVGPWGAVVLDRGFPAASAPPLRATYRLQMRNGFDFAAAARAAPYLARLGVSHLYLSPIFTAAPGSTHGYDIVDPNEIDPVLGGRAGFEALVQRVREHELGIVLDIVPNHLAAHENNRWWREMLRDGPGSVGGSVFDAAWDENDGRLVLPVLGADPAREIEAGALVLDATGVEPVVRYHDRWFPVAPGTGDGGDIAAVLGRQHYELAQWRSGLDRLAYRRFFDVTDLAGVRVEDPAVFDLTHALVLELVEAGLVDVLRVDHVDGLADPAAYLERLVARTDTPIYVEKILSAGEELPDGWPITGTTGYEVLSDLLLLHVDATGLREMDREYREDDDGRSFGEVERAAKVEMLHALFSPELARVSGHLHAALAADPSAGPAIEEAVAGLTVELDVYRSYVGLSEPFVQVSEADRERLRRVIDTARVDLDPAAAPYAAQLWSVLTDPAGVAARRFVTTWQQLTGPVMAKGREDTAIYRHVRILATNEVGVDPDAALAGDAVARFHERASERRARHPAALVTTATHDTKRGEDTRLRIALLSEAPGEWRRGFDLWLESMREAQPTGAAPTRREQRLIAQTVLGVWPVDDVGWGDFADRVVDSVRKAAREAKETTSWLEPDEAHEAALEAFVRVALEQRGASFIAPFGALLQRLGPAAAAASLGQVVLKIAGPGVADLYQGCEGWDLSLVDPDNRRPVDFDGAAGRLGELDAAAMAPAARLAAWPDGGVKQWVTSRALAARAADPELFLDGDYQPLTVRGPASAHVIVFERRLGDRSAIAIASRGRLALSFPEVSGPLDELWRETSIEAPSRPAGSAPWTDRLTGAVHHSAALPIAAVFGRLPTALLVSSS